MKHNYARPITLMQPERLVFPPGWVGHIPFAFWIVEAMQPRIFVELGTHTGNSFGAFTQAASALSLDGRFVAVDHWRGDEHAGSYDENTFEQVSHYFGSKYAGIAELMRMHFDEAVGSFEDGSVDLLHIDGFHSYEAVKHDFDTWLPKMSDRGVVLLHDTNVRERDFGVFRLMEELSRLYPTFEFLHSNGLGVVQTGAKAKNPIKQLTGEKTDGNGIAAREYFSRIGNAIVGQAFAEILLGKSLDDKPFDAALANIAWRRQEIENENEHLRTVQTHLASEKDSLANENRRFNKELSVQIAAKERLAAEYARLMTEKERLAAETERQIAEKDGLAAEYAKLMTEKDRLASEAERLAGETERLMAEKDRLASETERLMAEKDRLAAETRSQEYFLTLAGDRLAEGRATLLHRLRSTAIGHGADSQVENREALPFFDRDYYLRSNPDVAKAGLDPLVHYLVSGRREGRLPNPPAGGDDETSAPGAAAAEK